MWETFKAKLLGSLGSKTAWFGTVLAILGVVQQNSEWLKSVLSADNYGKVMSAVGVAVVALRWVTNAPVEQKVPGTTPEA
jgi:hypothetical protein